MPPMDGCVVHMHGMLWSPLRSEFDRDGPCSSFPSEYSYPHSALDPYTTRKHGQFTQTHGGRTRHGTMIAFR